MKFQNYAINCLTSQYLFGDNAKVLLAYRTYYLCTFFAQLLFDIVQVQVSEREASLSYSQMFKILTEFTGEIPLGVYRTDKGWCF